MKSVIKTIVFSLLLSLALVSCKDEGSVQTYFVEHQDLPDYKQMDLSANLMDFSSAELSAEEKETIQSLKKISFTGYRATGDETEYKQELEKAKRVFKNEKYNELMDFSMGGMKIKVNSIGTDDAVDEILVLMSSQKTGFGVARIIGDDINPEKVMMMINNMQKVDVDNSQLKSIMNFFN
ncbi:DUF4252 domain-containing protein [Lacinutrix neustonica]|uniref:DUF4252 domain-containing protein n=1 Tax=Lacinutrix neustonica TaxID=2980107 RepID=A0A9E8MYE6_9FLAO|nr:DUF4252 domain-containing protein [Lacinutrix neustonica]WAC03174.1 DUF4252 domain-containing protein [Lacinutrix neustonica]